MAFEFDELLVGSASISDDLALLGEGPTIVGSEKSVAENGIRGSRVHGDWFSRLDLAATGLPKPTLHNVELIIANDTRTAGLPCLNEFTGETVQRRAPNQMGPRKGATKGTRELDGPVWQVRDPMSGDLWSSARDYAVRSILEAPINQAGHGLKVSDRDLKAAIALAAYGNRFHPVREYLQSLEWDKRPRVKRLFIDYLGEPESAYAREVARLMMIAAVARIFEPGCKFDSAIVIEGPQGRGKSTFIRTLGKCWFSEFDGHFDDSKAAVEKMAGSWLIEIPELNGFNKTDVRAIKAFISRQIDVVRLAYEARAAPFPRQSILIGTTNDTTYLGDATGGRRFLPVECCVGEINTDKLAANVDQLWAEAYRIYRGLRATSPPGDLPLYILGADAQHEAAARQETRRIESVEDADAATIAEWLEMPIQTGDIGADMDAGGRREFVCLKQLWEQCFSGQSNAYDHAKAKQLGRSMALVPGWRLARNKRHIPGFGSSRYYERTA